MYKVHIQICVRIRENTGEEKICMQISEIRAQILSKERNLCTNLNRPARLHQDEWPVLYDVDGAVV